MSRQASIWYRARVYVTSSGSYGAVLRVYWLHVHLFLLFDIVILLATKWRAKNLIWLVLLAELCTELIDYLVGFDSSNFVCILLFLLYFCEN